MGTHVVPGTPRLEVLPAPAGKRTQTAGSALGLPTAAPTCWTSAARSWTPGGSTSPTRLKLCRGGASIHSVGLDPSWDGSIGDAVFDLSPTALTEAFDPAHRHVIVTTALGALEVRSREAITEMPRAPQRTRLLFR